VANVLKDECQYFTVPRAASAVLPDLKGSSVKLYWALFDIAQQRSAVQIAIPSYVIGDLTGLSPNSVHDAGEQLQKHGLVECKKIAHGMISYTIINPEKKKPLPPPVRNPKTGERFKGTYHFEGQPGRSARTARKARFRVQPPAPPPSVPSWDEIGSSESQNLRSTFSKIDDSASNFANLDSAKSLKKQSVESDPVSLNTSEKKGISEQAGVRKSLPPEKKDVREKKAAPLAKNPHADDGRGYPASWDDIAPEWEPPTFIFIPKGTREYKKLVAGVTSQLDFKALAAGDAN